MANVETFILSLLGLFELLLLSLCLGINISDHSIEKFSQVIILIQIASVAGEVPQVL